MIRKQTEKRKREIGLVCGALLLATPAVADTVTVGISIDDGPIAFYSGHNVGVVQGGWQIGAAEASRGFELDAITNSTGHLMVYITTQDNTDPYTGFATVEQNIRTLTAGGSLSEAIYYDQANRAFNGTLLDGDAFTAPGLEVDTYTLNLAAPYSMTAIFSVYGPVTLTADINVGQNHPVPAPILGAGIPGLLAGALALIALMRRRRS